MEQKSTQDYLKTVYNLSKNDERVNTTEISEKLGVTPASVTEMLKKLAHEGYVDYSPYHGSTLTDTTDSAFDLLTAVDHPNVKTFWQPPNGMSPAESLAGLNAVAPWVTSVHCFHWWPTSQDRYPLSVGEANWESYLARIAALPGDHFVSVEYVKDDAPAQFLQDAATLKRWLARWG